MLNYPLKTQSDINISSFEDLATFTPAVNNDPVTTASQLEAFDRVNDGEFRNGEVVKLLKLVNRIEDANEEKRRGKSVDLFRLLPKEREKTNHKNSNEIKKNLPDHIKAFFLPASKIIPKQYKKKRNHISEEDPYAPMYDFEDSDENDLKAECYTHTIHLEGECWVACDRVPIRPCDPTNRQREDDNYL